LCGLIHSSALSQSEGSPAAADRLTWIEAGTAAVAAAAGSAL
jgi:hypothetical protein